MFSRELRMHMQMADLEDLHMQILSSENCAEKTDNMFFLVTKWCFSWAFPQKIVTSDPSCVHKEMSVKPKERGAKLE